MAVEQAGGQRSEKNRLAVVRTVADAILNCCVKRAPQVEGPRLPHVRAMGEKASRGTPENLAMSEKVRIRLMRGAGWAHGGYELYDTNEMKAQREKESQLPP